MLRAGRIEIGRLLVSLGLMALAPGGRAMAQGAFAPAAPSYAAILKSIDEIRDAWTPTAPPEAPGWYDFFGALRGDIEAYPAAGSWADRLAALEKVEDRAQKLAAASGWAPAARLRAAVSDWVGPRLALARAERDLAAALAGPAMNDEANRKDWSTFVDDRLGGPLRDYEAARTVQARHAAGARLHEALDALRKTASWPYAARLQAAADALFNAPNLDVSADVAALSPLLSTQVVASGPITRGGYTSQVTAGPYAGFGLLACDQGIAFTNSQYMSSVTPITDFEQQVERDPQGRRAAKLYRFGATSTDSGMLTITAILTPYGLQLQPASSHHIDARVCSAPTEGHGLARGVAALVGLNERKVDQKVHDSAIGKIRQSVRQGAAEEAAERTAIAQAQQNAKIHQALPGDGTARVKDIEIDGLSLRSQPTNALIGGRLTWSGVPAQAGADMPQPPRFAVPAAGISADIHLASIANNMVAGYLQSPDAVGVRNLMVETHKPAPGEKPGDALKVTENIDFPAYLKKVEETATRNDPSSQVIRIKKPARAPEVGVDADGDLVVIAHDLQIDLPVPAQMANSPLGGARAKVYRLDAKTAEFVFTVKPLARPDGTTRLTGNLKALNPAPGSRVLAIDEDESKAVPLDPFRSVLIYQGFANAIRAKPLDLPVENLKLKGYVITSISDLDPTGWMRIVLSPTGEHVIGEGAPPPVANPSVTPVASADAAPAPPAVAQ